MDEEIVQLKKECREVYIPGQAKKLIRILESKLKELEKVSEEGKESLEQRLKKHLIFDLRQSPNRPFLVSGKYSWTTHELALEIENETQDGIEVLKRLIILTVDLISRGKEKLKESEKSNQEALAKAWEEGKKAIEEYKGLKWDVQLMRGKPKNPYTKD